MKNLLMFLFVLSVVCIISCTNNSNLDSSNLVEIDLENTEMIKKFQSRFGNDFEISRMYDITIENERFEYAEGKNKEGYTVEARISQISGFGESCTGVGCSACRILSGGKGCTCDRKATKDGYCNHSVSSGGDE